MKATKIVRAREKFFLRHWAYLLRIISHNVGLCASHPNRPRSIGKRDLNERPVLCPITFDLITLNWDRNSRCSFHFDWRWIYCSLTSAFYDWQFLHLLLAAVRARLDVKFIFFATPKCVICSNYRLGLININGLTTNWSLLPAIALVTRLHALGALDFFSVWKCNSSCHHMILSVCTSGCHLDQHRGASESDKACEVPHVVH